MSDVAVIAPGPTWDMNSSRKLVGEKYGASQLATFRPVLRAVSIRLAHARIHYSDYKRLLETHIDKPLHGGVSIWELMLASDDEAIGANNRFFITCEAHLYACVQALHAIADNLAHVAYYALGWNLDGRLPLHKVSMKTVSSRLQEGIETSTDLVPVHKAFTDLNARRHFRTLSDITNHLKHHGGLHTILALGPGDDEPYQMMISSFVRNEALQPQREVSAYLRDAYETMDRATVEIGCALNSWLAENP